MGESKRRKEQGAYPEQTEKPTRKRMTQADIMRILGSQSASMASVLSVAEAARDQANALDN